MKVLVLHASGLHLGFLGCYGNTWITTPHLDRLASEAVVFDQHHADCPGVRTAWSGLLTTAIAAMPGVPELLRRRGIMFLHVDAEQLPKAAGATRLETTPEAAVATLQQMLDQPSWLCWVDLPTLQPPWDAPEEFASRYLVPEGEDAEEDPDDELRLPLPAPAVAPIDRDDLVLWERLRCTYAG